MHTQGQVIEFIELVFGDAKLTNAGLNACVLCPKCNVETGETTKKKLVIRTDNWLNHCWKCGYKSKSIFHLLQKFFPHHLDRYINEFDGASYISDNTAEEFKLDKQLVLPHGFQLLAEWFDKDNVPLHIYQAKKYLLSRGLGYEDFWYWKFGVTNQDADYKNRIIVPSFDETGELNFFVSRSFKPGVSPKYLNPSFDRDNVVFNEINIDWSAELTLVEGPFDLAKCNDNATCLLGKELDDSYKLFRKVVSHNTPVAIALDTDATREAMEIARLFCQYGIRVRMCRLPPGIKDPGSMSRNAFVQNLLGATVVSEEDYLLYRVNSL